MEHRSLSAAVNRGDARAGVKGLGAAFLDVLLVLDLIDGLACLENPGGVHETVQDDLHRLVESEKDAAASCRGRGVEPGIKKRPCHFEEVVIRGAIFPRGASKKSLKIGFSKEQTPLDSKSVLEAVGVDRASREKHVIYIHVDRLEALRGDGRMDHACREKERDAV